tara:strand:+ start:846 stop:1262 length:417 start_codon:yes stop_codon:yes gene_type:complete
MNLNIENIIESNEGYFMFSRNNCTYCELVEEYFKLRGLKLSIVLIPEYKERVQLYALLNEYLKVDNIRTVPQLFLDQTHIGGFSHLETHFSKKSFLENIGNASVYYGNEWTLRNTPVKELLQDSPRQESECAKCCHIS